MTIHIVERIMYIFYYGLMLEIRIIGMLE